MQISDISTLHYLQPEKANSVFARLNKIWKNRKLSLQIKMRLYELLILSTLLYSAETWNMTVANRKKLEGAHYR